MENNNKKNLLILLVLVIAIGLTFYLSTEYKKKQDNSKSEEETKEKTEEEVIETVIETNENEQYTPYGESTITNKDKITYKELGDASTLVFNKGKYEVRKLNKNNEIFENENYIVLNISNKIVSVASIFGFIDGYTNAKDYIYFFRDGSEPNDYGIVDVKNNKISSGYFDGSCRFHSDERAEPCDDRFELTIVRKIINDKTAFDLFSLDEIIPITNNNYSKMYFINKDRILVEKNNKNGIINSKGEEVVKLEYDFIGYNKYLGYLMFKGENIYLFDEELKSIDLNTNKFDDLYTTAYNKDKAENNEHDFFPLTIADSFYWSSGIDVLKYNINDKYSLGNEENYIKYKGNKFTGEHIVLFDVGEACYSKPYIYVIENNKAYRVESNDVEIKYAYCF